MTDKPLPMTDEQMETLRADLDRAGFGGMPCLLGNYHLSRLLASHDAEKAAHAKTKKELECMKASRDEAIGHMDRLQKQLDLIGS